MDAVADKMEEGKEKAKEKALEKATDIIKEKAGCFGCLVGCLGPVQFMKTVGGCALDKEASEQVNGILDKIDDL